MRTTGGPPPPADLTRDPSGGRLTDEQRVDWLRLIRTDGIGPRTFRGLVNRFGGAAAALDALPALGAKAGRRPVAVLTRADAERELERGRRLGIRFVAAGEPDYPRVLQAIDTAPPLIAVQGDAAALRRPMVAIVGSRNASANGLVITERLARGLGEEGFVVVSGLARGIDTRAHRASLASGTVAVLAGGHERIYPSENEELVRRIAGSGGAVVSEMPLGWEPRGQDFPRRNRVVSGLCYGVVVVEAARRSGSLITARLALEQGREVFAVPGSPLDPRAEGTNDLIRAGATLCGSADHVASVLAPLVETGRVGQSVAREPDRATLEDWDLLWGEIDFDGGSAERSAAPSADRPDDDVPGDERSMILRLLGPAPVGTDELARQAGLPIRSVQLVLFELELEGRLERHGANAVSLIAS